MDNPNTKCEGCPLLEYCDEQMSIARDQGKSEREKAFEMLKENAFKNCNGGPEQIAENQKIMGISLPESILGISLFKEREFLLCKTPNARLLSHSKKTVN